MGAAIATAVRQGQDNALVLLQDQTSLEFAESVVKQTIERFGHIACVQPDGNDTITWPRRDGVNHGRVVESTTQIGGIQVTQGAPRQRYHPRLSHLLRWQWALGP